MDLSEFFGVRVRIVLVLLRKGAMTQSALARELGTNHRVLRRHLNWLVSNGIVIKYGTPYTIYEPNPNHPITKTLQELLNLNSQQRKNGDF
jgi:predicted ArsR family transcriptional regulator